MLHTEFLVTFVTCLHKKCHVSTSYISLFIAIKPKAE